MKKRVLFVCTGNSVRSQMAEALLKNMAPENYEVFSAGSHPAPIHELTKSTLLKNNKYQDNFTSNQINEFKNTDLDYVIVLCEVAFHYLPEFSSDPQIIKWFMDDPISILGSREKQEQGFQMAFDQIKSRIQKFINSNKSE
ncbi:MAG: arsenate reductase ArsC [Candidatus Marinimicrobia bacterium]|nr:arsenate reductase ArsC [Candidatus Neomarinimicrobiota bacterium]